jgi:tetratricopeptide (TPR) repeat protein
VAKAINSVLFFLGFALTPAQAPLLGQPADSGPGAGARVESPAPAAATAPDTGQEASLEAVLADYREAFATGNPLRLQAYDPTFRVFEGLYRSAWFDHVRQSKVALADPVTKPLSVEEGRYEVAFTKVQEDLNRDGQFTRGVTGIRMEVQLRDGRATVLSHRSYPPPGAAARCQSHDPRSWGEEHSPGERSLFLGLEHLREGDLGKAEEEVFRAVELAAKGQYPAFLMGPTYFIGMCYYYSGLLKMKRGTVGGAARDLDVARQIKTDFPAALNLRGQIHLGESELEPALRAWEKSLALDPEQPEIDELSTLLSAASTTTRKGLKGLLLSLVNLPPSAAVQVLVPEVKKAPREPTLVPLLAKAYLNTGDPEKALEVLRSSKRVGRSEEETYLAARANLKLDQAEEALELLETVRKMDPAYRDTQVLLVGLYAGLGRYQEALSCLDVTAVPDQAGVSAALRAKYSLLTGRFLDAVSALEEALKHKLPARVRAEVVIMLQRISRQGR